MVDIAKLRDSEIPPDLREREKFLNTIRAVAEEIGYGPERGDTYLLLRILNERGIPYPDFRRRKFDLALQYARPWETPIELRVFLKYHLPDLWEATASRRRARREDVNAGINTAPLTTEPVRTELPATSSGDNDGQGTQEQSRRPLRILGWTIQEDKRGIHRAFKRIGGKLRAAYLGRSLEGAEQKLRAAEQKIEAKVVVVEPEY